MNKTTHCFICDDRQQNGQQGLTLVPMVIPPFTKPVWVCGMCLHRAYSKPKEE